MSSESENTTSYQAHTSEWAKLARQDPEAFEAMRLKLVNDFIKNSPPNAQQRLKCIQWKVEHLRQRADTPAAALIAISNMMWESTRQLGRRQQELLDLCTGKKVNTSAHNNSGKILSFKRVAKR